MSFIVYDLAFLVAFLVFASVFLYLKRENLKKEGGLLLYKTSWGIKLIESVGDKHKKLLHFISYFSLGTGYILMVLIMFLIIQTVYIYLTTPIIQIFKAPPIMPLIPYFPQLFGLQSFFPPFYFIYFILSIAVVLTVHEFSHGIFAKSFGIRIKSTGFAFLKWFPALFGAFVEQDDKQMVKKSKFAQMSVLSAGVFANLITSLVFLIILAIFFSYAFVPSGILFNTYSYSIVDAQTISSINGIPINDISSQNILNLINEEGINKIVTDDGQGYIAEKKSLVNQEGYFVLYNDAPAINSELIGAITSINNEKIDSIEKLGSVIGSYQPGEEVVIKTMTSEGEKVYNIILGEHPEKDGQAWLGIGFVDQDQSTFTRKIVSKFTYKDAHTYYQPRFDGISIFIHDLLWWIFLINLLVALMNMMPVGFLDGGQFFYLTVLGITKSEKIARQTFSAITYFILFLFLVLMIKWVFGIF